MILSRKSRRKVSKEHKRAHPGSNGCLGSFSVSPAEAAGSTVHEKCSLASSMGELAVELLMASRNERGDATVDTSSSAADAADDHQPEAVDEEGVLTDPATCSHIQSSLLAVQDERAVATSSSRTKRWVDECLFDASLSASTPPPARISLQPPSVEATKSLLAPAAAHTNGVALTDNSSSDSERRSSTSTLVVSPDRWCNTNGSRGLATCGPLDHATHGYDRHSEGPSRGPSHGHRFQTWSSALYTPAPTIPVGRLFPYDWSPGATLGASKLTSKPQHRPSPQHRSIARPHPIFHFNMRGHYEQGLGGTAQERYDQLRYPNYTQDARSRALLNPKELKSTRLFREYTLRNYGCEPDEARYLPHAATRNKEFHTGGLRT